MLKISNKFSKSGVSKIPGARSLHTFFTKLTDPQGVILTSVQGSKMYVNTQDKAIVPHLLSEGVWEEYETELFHKYIKPGDVVVDIGANIGYYTLIAAKLTGKDGKVYSFEPEPNNYELLVRNIKVNRYNNVTPVQKALSDKKGELKLHLDKLNLGSHSFIEIDDPKRKGGEVTVDTITLDEFFKEEGKDRGIDFIKMDAEGAEGLVVEGAKYILQKYAPKIIMEFWTAALRKIGTEPIKLLEDFQGYGYGIKLIEIEKHQMKKLSIEKIIEYCDVTLGGLRQVNLFLEK
jgi:FkbM family methyltransferase